MKPLLLLFCLLVILQNLSAQSPDYIAVRKKNGRTIKNFYAGSQILFQTNNGSYVQGPIKMLRNDTVFVLLYDIRFFATTFGTLVKDTISVQTLAFNYKEIKRIQLSKKPGFVRRTVGPLLMFGGAGYFTLNLLNGTFFSSSVSDEEKLRTAAIAAGLFGVGYLITRLFSSDGFSKAKHKIIYVDL